MPPPDHIWYNMPHDQAACVVCSNSPQTTPWPHDHAIGHNRPRQTTLRVTCVVKDRIPRPLDHAMCDLGRTRPHDPATCDICSNRPHTRYGRTIPLKTFSKIKSLNRPIKRLVGVANILMSCQSSNPGFPFVDGTKSVTLPYSSL